MAKNKDASFLVFAEHYTEGEASVEKMFSWGKRSCLIKDRRGGVFFEMKNVQAPEAWSPLAVDIAASKYFRKKARGFAGETSVQHLVQRVVASIREAGLKQGGYFSNKKQADIFAKELSYILYSQTGAFNSPVWFNVGLDRYGISSASEHCGWDEKSQSVQPVKDAFARPQCSACFIQSVEDSLESIFNLAKSEAKLFKYGSGSGTNFSNLRSKYEPLLNGGGTSSGLISFLEVLDRGAGAIKSGGTTRRAAKMVCVDLDHPEILDFIEWKLKEEKKAQVLINAGYEADFEGDAYHTVAGQNANNSVRIPNTFMKALAEKKDWDLKARVSGKTILSVPAGEVWQKIVHSAWACADPGLQFHDTINQWHTCPASAEIHASNPCSEYMFVDDSACNLASINLVKFLGDDGEFDSLGFLHTARILFVAQDILVDYAGYPTAKIALNSHRFRPLGLGFANLGSFLMRKALPYDSDEGRAWASALACLLHGAAYWTSAQMAESRGPFAEFTKNKKPMLKVMQNHHRAVGEIPWELLPASLKVTSEELWDDVLEKGTKSGFRNAQATVIAPTGTIGFLMDCDTTGIEPDFSLVKYKKLVGGGEMEIVNQAVPVALRRLQYSEDAIEKITGYVRANHSIEGCPQLLPQHLAIFDCASAENGQRVLSPESHLLMMAAVQPFVSGAISKTVNMPSTATEEQISHVYLQAWKLGLKAVAVYRDRSKGSQPLSQRKDPAKKGEAMGAGIRWSAPNEDFKIFGGARPPMKCPECGEDTVLASGCYRCPNCGSTVGCA
jgi:ribonucleoside-diphosphate reductase alpha chain